ncbi:MAG: hypothetical protein ACRC8S_10090 [Fimbriiglobus sp.]
MWKHRRRGIQSLAIVAIVVLAYWSTQPAKPPALEIREDVTFITGPLDADGYIDFETALNERLSAGVTPENNAAVLLWQAIGPKPDPHRPTHPDFWAALGISAPPEEGRYFTPFLRWEMQRKGLEDVTQEVADVSSDLRYWKWYREDEEIIKRWLLSQSEVLEKIRQASLKPRYYSPIISRDEKTGRKDLLVKSSPACAFVTEAIIKEVLLVRALFRIQQRDFEGAWEDVMTCQRLARLFSQGLTIEAHLSLRIHEMSAIVLAEILHAAAWDEDHLRRKLEAWEKLPPWKPLLEMMEYDRLLNLSCLEATRRDGQLSKQIPLVYSGHLFKMKVTTHHTDWNVIYRSIQKTHQKCIEIYKNPDAEIQQSSFKTMRSELKTTLSRIDSLGQFGRYFPPLFTDQELAAVFSRMIVFVNENHSFLDADRVTSQDMIRTSFALAIYRCQHGEYPESLDQLQLQRIPYDRFAKEPVIYAQVDEGYILASQIYEQTIEVPRPLAGPKPPPKVEPEP